MYTKCSLCIMPTSTGGDIFERNKFFLISWNKGSAFSHSIKFFMRREEICRYMDQKGLLTSTQSAGVAPEGNLRNRIQARKRASENSTLALKPRSDIPRSPKQWYQWPHEKDLCPPKIF